MNIYNHSNTHRNTYYTNMCSLCTYPGTLHFHRTQTKAPFSLKRNSGFYRYFGTNYGGNALIQNKQSSCSGTSVSAGEVVVFRIGTCAGTKCGGNAVSSGNSCSGAFLRQAITSCQKYSITGFAKCLIVEMVNRQAKDNDTESSIMEISPWVALC